MSGIDRKIPGELYDKGGAVYNIQHPDFAGGALGDDSHDDTAAFQAALSTLSAGDTLEIPPGTYKITSTLVVTKNIKIRGSGNGWWAPTTSSHIKLYGSVGIFDLNTKCVIEDIELTAIGGAAYGFQFSSAQIQLKRVSISGGVIIGIQTVGQLPWIHLESCIFSGCSIGINANTGGTNWNVDKCIFYGNYGTDFVAGGSNPIYSLSITGCAFDLFGSAGDSACCLNLSYVRGLTLTGNYFETDENGGSTGQLIAKFTNSVLGGIVGGNYLNGNGSHYLFDLRATGIQFLKNIEWLPNFIIGSSGTLAAFRINGAPSGVYDLSIKKQYLSIGTGTLLDSTSYNDRFVELHDDYTTPTDSAVTFGKGVYLRSGAIDTPSWSFSADRKTGAFHSGGFSIGWTFAGTQRIDFQNGDIVLLDNAKTGWCDGNFAHGLETYFDRVAAHTIALRDGTNAKQFRVYGDSTKYTSLRHDGTDGLVTTSSGDLKLSPAGSVRFGTHSNIAAETLTGYILMKDTAGNLRKLGVIS